MADSIRHIAVNTRFLLPGGLEGMGRFTHEILNRWVKDHPQVRFSFFFDRPFDEHFLYGPNVKGYVLSPPARHPVLFWIWFELRVTAMLKKLKPDVFFSPDGFLSLRADLPQVPVFHDLAFLRYPGDIKMSEAWFYKRYFPMYAAKAARILAVSDYTRQDVHRNFSIPLSKMDLVPNACSEVFRPISETEKISIRKKYTSGEKYFYFVGALQPRKNLVNLIGAFNRFKADTGSPYKLVIVGRKAWNFDQIIHSYRDSVYKNDIVFTGFVSDEELNAITAASEALCYVSYFEGFGIPILEAMNAGTAVICSNLSSMPEVAGGAALLVDPASTESIADAMRKISEDESLRLALIHKGEQRKSAFSWAHSAALAWQALEKAIISNR